MMGVSEIGVYIYTVYGLLNTQNNDKSSKPYCQTNQYLYMRGANVVNHGFNELTKQTFGYIPHSNEDSMINIEWTDYWWNQNMVYLCVCMCNI